MLQIVNKINEIGYNILSKLIGGIKLDTKKLTEAGIFSSILIVLTLLAAGSGLMYSIFLDLGVPIIITLIYMKCGFKYTLLSSIVSLVFTSLFLGDICCSLFMAQGIIIGILCGYLLSNNDGIYDNIFYAVIFSSVMIVGIDMFLSNFIGGSFIKELNQSVSLLNISDKIKEIIFNLSVFSLPFGTVLVTMLGSLFFGNKLNVLNQNSRKKYIKMIKAKKHGESSSCSKKVMLTSIIYIFIATWLKIGILQVDIVYANVLFSIVEYIMLYILFIDFKKTISKAVNKITSNNNIVIFINSVIIVLLYNSFILTFLGLLCIKILIPYAESFVQRKKLELSEVKQN